MAHSRIQVSYWEVVIVLILFIAPFSLMLCFIFQIVFDVFSSRNAHMVNIVN